MPDGAFFRRRLAGLGIPAGPRTILGLGISGGPDSTALLALACAWSRDCGARVVALCLDHRLRPGSTAEAEAAAALARDLGATARVLTWDGDRPGSAIQEQARDRRLDALSTACCQHGALFLLLAHHADDQAETIRMRRERSTSPHSLSGMAMVAFRRDVAIVRPLLDVPKADLIAFCQHRGLPFVRDPSNLNPAFERVRIRARLTARDAAALCDEARTAAAVRARDVRAVADCLARCTLDAGEDRLRLDAETFASAPRPVALETLRHIARSLSGSAYLPRPKPLYETIPETGTGRLTWGGCLWTRHRIAIAAAPHVPASAARPDAVPDTGRAMPPRPPNAAGKQTPAVSDPGRTAPTDAAHAPGTAVNACPEPRTRPVLSVCRAAMGALTRRVALLPEGRPVLWDGRYELTACGPGLGVRALGKAPPPRTETLIATAPPADAPHTGAAPATSLPSETLPAGSTPTGEPGAETVPGTSPVTGPASETVPGPPPVNGPEGSTKAIDLHQKGVKPGPGSPVIIRVAPSDTPSDHAVPGIFARNTLEFPPDDAGTGQTSVGAVRARYRPPFPVLEEGLRLEADGQEPYIHS